MLHSNNDKDREFIQSTIRSKGGSAPPRIKVPKTTGVNPDHIYRAVCKTYQPEIHLDVSDRIINGIEHLTHQYPDQAVPLNILYWMCFGGKKLKSQGSEDIERFKRQVSASQRKMWIKHSRSFRLAGGTVCGLTTREQHAVEALPRCKKAVVNKFQGLEIMAGIVGDVNTLQLPEAQKEETRKILSSVKHIGQHVKALALLGPVPTKKK